MNIRPKLVRVNLLPRPAPRLTLPVQDLWPPRSSQGEIFNSNRFRFYTMQPLATAKIIIKKSNLLVSKNSTNWTDVFSLHKLYQSYTNRQNEFSKPKGCLQFTSYTSSLECTTPGGRDSSDSYGYYHSTAAEPNAAYCLRRYDESTSGTQLWGASEFQN